MIIQMLKGATQEQLDHVVDRAHSLGFDVQLNVGTDKVVVAIVGSRTGEVSTDVFAVLPGVDDVARIMRPYKLASREFKPEGSTVDVSGLQFGGTRILVIAGPCAVESEEQMMFTARAVNEAGAAFLRGGAFKPRTSPFSFQGLELDGMEILAKVRMSTGMPVVTEVTDPHYVEPMSHTADLLQVGARNMQNYTLLRELGRSGHPTLLKRGLSSTIAEWLTAADYILNEGNDRVILCERGIRTFENATRFTLDVATVAVVKKHSHLPIIVDPSHAAGHAEYVPSLAKAAVAAGADGLLIEVHPNPEEALSDGLQSLTPEAFNRLMEELRPIARAIGREI